jgi:catechol 2,3-dioxygenase-like lactoylglutathione lyase family enzyme
MKDRLITGFSAVRLFVSDLERAVDFYQNALGLELANKEALYAVFQLQNVTLLVERMDPGHTEFKDLVGRFAGISFTTKDIRFVYERLSSTGVCFEGPPEKQFWGGILAHFHDPDHNVLTLVQVPTPA